MPLDENVYAPDAQTVLFHLTLFLEFCEDHEAEESSVSTSCECLRDAIEELCQFLAASAFTSNEPAALVTAFQQSQTAFRNAMPDLHQRTGAERGFSALIALVESSAASERCFDRERRSTALGVARRFGRTLGTFAGSREADTMHLGKRMPSQRLAQHGGPAEVSA